MVLYLHLLKKPAMHELPGHGLYMVPVPIAEGATDTLSPEVVRVTAGLRFYFVEDARTARRVLRSLHKDLVLESVTMSVIDKHSGPDLEQLRAWLRAGYPVGVMSESGCPGIADPGAQLAAVAQAMGAKVIPLTGPNSIVLALMASGLNGQSFCFRGYLPVKEPARSKAIKDHEAVSSKEQQTQIFIETPYRNGVLVNDLLKTCAASTRLCLACNVTGTPGSVVTKTIAEWRQSPPVMEKLPTVFLLLGR
jgi:16S rRNA (cytidine1402-2'-O)-methyltransferase